MNNERRIVFILDDYVKTPFAGLILNEKLTINPPKPVKDALIDNQDCVGYIPRLTTRSRRCDLECAQAMRLNIPAASTWRGETLED